MSEVEIWASPEPTVARTATNRWRNQLVETGHGDRDADVSLLASLGVRATRYPVLWELVAPVRPAWRDYRWSDRRLEALMLAGIEPIVTLLHHGSGPPYTSLVDPDFPELFAAYAGATAQRYPWVRRWTPINEPLTTARFSTLYATWYPNRFFDHEAFGRAIFNEAMGTLLAMRDIRKHVPGAQLLLTEDLQGFRAADRGMEEYVEHKGQRRFLSAELIMGRVVPGHPLWTYLTTTCALPVRDLERLRWFSLPIDLIGWNYYPNSERVLFSDGAGHRNVGLVDVEPEKLSCEERLIEAWERLRVPMALSEVHCIGSETQRARWMLQRFADVRTAAGAGVDVRAFGAWAAFGMVDWTSLLCRDENVREDGVFTCEPAGHEPRPTLVAATVRELARGRIPKMPDDLGWWEMPRAAVA